MINPFSEINWKPDKTEIRKFGRTVLIGFIVISVILALLHFSGLKQSPKMLMLVNSLLVAGISIFLLSLISTSISKPIYMIWFFVAACMGTVVSNLILIIFFLLIFTPIGLFMRLLGRDPLKLKAPKSSNWDDYKTKTDLKRYYRQY